MNMILIQFPWLMSWINSGDFEVTLLIEFSGPSLRLLHTFKRRWRPYWVTLQFLSCMTSWLSQTIEILCQRWCIEISGSTASTWRLSEALLRSFTEPSRRSHRNFSTPTRNTRQRLTYFSSSIAVYFFCLIFWKSVFFDI